MNVRVVLPGGVWADGVRHTEAELRALTGEDETFLALTGRSLLPAHRATALLSRCVLAFGTLPVTTELIRGLTVGDREALLLHLRRVTLGDRLAAVLACPAPGCGEMLDLDLPTGAFLVPPYASCPPLAEASLSEGGRTYAVRFRLPTGGDQEAVARAGLEDVAGAAEDLLRRCVVAVTDEAGSLLAEAHWPAGTADVVAANMAERDPQSELRLNLTCPTCGSSFSTVLDAASFFFRELDARLRDLLREVHLLAFHYHWREADILGLTPWLRHRYAEALVENLEGLRP